MRHPPEILIAALLVGCSVSGCCVSGCGATGKTDDHASSQASAVVSSGKLGKPELGALGDQPTRFTEDGIPILEAKVDAPAKEGEVVFIRQDLKALDTVVGFEASDGKHIYLVVDEGSSILVRDGVVTENVLGRYGFEGGGCGAARDGTLLLSGVGPTGGSEEVEEVNGQGQRRRYSRPEMGQTVVLVDARGKERRIAVPPQFGEEKDCRAWLAGDGTFSLALNGIVHHDGKAFTNEAPGWYAGRTVMGAPKGPKLCFWSCNGTEQAETHVEGKQLLRALDFRSGAMPEWIAHDLWVAGVGGGKAVRKQLGSGDIEVLEGVTESTMLNGMHDIAFTADHDVVIGLDYRFHRYVVWPHGKKALSPVRTLGAGERIAHASPTILVRGISTPIPESDTSAVVLGKDIGIGTGGSTVRFSDLRRGAQAHKARMDRARKVLPAGSLVAMAEAVVEKRCGAYVRSPAGWEGETIHDWVPPQLPALSPKAVHKPGKCLALEHLNALPGDEDLLLGIHQGELWAAYLPPRLPLPQGTSHWHQGPPPAPPPPVTPVSGTGWSRIGPVDAIDGDHAIADPGGNTTIAYGTWQAGGAAVLTAGGETILLTTEGAVTVPKGTLPMAVGQTTHLWLYGAIGSKLVACKSTCRILDPGPQSDLVAVVPRSEDVLVLGYADGRIGTYRVPASGGQAVPQHALVATLNAFLKTKP